MGGGGGGASKLKKAAKKMVIVACGSFCTTKSPPHISDSSTPALSATKTTKSFFNEEEKGEEDKEVEITEQMEDSIANNNSLPSKSLCAICLDPLNYKSKGSSPGQAIFTAQCSHAFHFTCISSNVRHGSITCPICRAYWTQLPRHLNLPSSSRHNDPILRILDDSIATLRIHRRSFLRSARYDDDDPVEPDHTPTQSRLHFSLIPVSPSAPTPHNGCNPHYYYPFPYHAPNLHNHFTSFGGSSSLLPSPKTRACLVVKSAYQQAIDLVLVACPNGPHLRLFKQAMALVVFSLRTIDRLAIITYSSSLARVFPLRRMTSNGKRSALQIIDRLFYTGHADPLEGLKKAVKILEDRTHKNPQSSILHLSDTPTRSRFMIDMEIPIPIHRFHIGFGFGASSGFVMNEFEEFLARLLGGVIRDIQVRIGEEGSRITRLGELRGGEEKRIVLDLSDCSSRHVSVRYSYVEGEVDECIKTGEALISLGNKSLSPGLEDEEDDDEDDYGRDSSFSGRTSSVESWDYHDPFMARRWAKHLHGYRL